MREKLTIQYAWAGKGGEEEMIIRVRYVLMLIPQSSCTVT